jgi:hypothetical protein
VVTTIGARRLKARAQIATVIGLPLAAAALVTDVFLLIWRYAGGIPPLRDELPEPGDPWSGGAWFACVKSRLPPVP